MLPGCSLAFRDAKERFSQRVADYVRYRPGYPAGVLAILQRECGLTLQSVVADIGSGTGLLARLFLENGNAVFGVEPNAEMLAAGEECLRGCPKFTSVAGSAEETSLPDHSVDLVAAGQAFHWFDAAKARQEFRRILRPPAWVAIVWNERLLEATPFLRGYEALLRKYGTDYARVNDSYPREEQMQAFFGAGNYSMHQLPNEQQFDLEGLRGRLKSSSYIPLESDARYAEMMQELNEIFAAHQQHGRVSMQYLTRIYVGKLQHDRKQR